MINTVCASSLFVLFLIVILLEAYTLTSMHWGVFKQAFKASLLMNAGFYAVMAIAIFIGNWVALRPSFFTSFYYILAFLVSCLTKFYILGIAKRAAAKENLRVMLKASAWSFVVISVYLGVVSFLGPLVAYFKLLGE